MKNALGAIVLLFCFNTLTLQSQVKSSAPDWYEESLIHTHHSAGLPSPEWETQFERVGPDAVQFHTRAYSVGKELSVKYNFSFVTTLSRSGHWSDVSSIVESLPLEEQELFFIRVNPDGSPAGRMKDGQVMKHLCFYSPGIDKHILPLYENVTEQYHPAQIWIDHTIITVNLCYCENCKSNFLSLYGVAPPLAAGNAYWDEWVKYHRDGFDLWMEKVYNAAKKIDPSTLVTFNHAYFINQPEPPPFYIRNLSADIHSSIMNNCLFARYATTVGIPFDLMPGLTDTWAGTIPKTEQEVVQTAAVITANGGRWNIGEFPMSQYVQPADKMLDLAVAGADLVKERKEWSHNTSLVPLVAVLQSASTHYARIIPPAQYIYNVPGPTRLYWYNNLSVPDEIYGAGAALLENNIPFDIINESTLKERLKDYKVLIAGDQFRLDDETVLAIREYVEAGGALLATGRTAESDLAELLGVKVVSGMLVDKLAVNLGGVNIVVYSPLKIETDGAEVLNRFSDVVNSPAITRHVQGNGRIIYIAGDFFRTYMEASTYNPKSLSNAGNTTMRGAVDNWINDIAPNLGFSCTAPPWIEVASRRKGNNMLIQLVERTFEWKNKLYQTQEPVEIKLSQKIYPENVLLQPWARKIPWEWRNDSLFVTVPLNEIKLHSIVEVKEAFGYEFKQDTIFNIPFGTRIDTLYRRLGKNPSADWAITFVDGIERADLKTGDKLIITEPGNSIKEYYLQLNDYTKSPLARLGVIYLNSDSLAGFKSSQYNYTVYLPSGTDFPVISAYPQNINATVNIERPENINGGPEHRTAKIHVTAEDDSTSLLYTLKFEILKEKEPFHADPFFSQVINGVYIGTGASGWGKGFEIFNPGSSIISMEDYLIANATAGTLTSVVNSKDMSYRMRPGFTIDSSRIATGIYFNSRPYPFNTSLEPGKTLVFGRGSPTEWNTANVFRDLCDFRDTNGDFAYASGLYGFVDGARICFFGNNNSLFLIRIDNDSIFNGLKHGGDPADYTLIDIFGTQGINNNRMVEGSFVDQMSAISLVRKNTIWKGNPENYGSFGTSEPGSGEWDKYQGAVNIGEHSYIPYTGHYTTIYSLLYDVSGGYGPGQEIGMVPPGTNAEVFLFNVYPDSPGAHLSIMNSDSTLIKTDSDSLVTGDKLIVLSATSHNSTVYTINIQQPANNALLTSSSYNISTSGAEGLVEGIPAFTTIEDLLLKINVPPGARLSVVDSRGQLTGIEKVLNDAYVVIKTIVSDSIRLEVIAEDGITRIDYKLSITVDDPYVTSDFYLLRQDRRLIDMFGAGITVRNFLSRLVPSTGASLSVRDKMGNIRNMDGIMYKDDQLLVTDGTKTTVYSLRAMNEFSDARLKEIAVGGVSLEGFNPAQFSYVLVLDQSSGIPGLPEVTAVTNSVNADHTIIQAESLQGTEALRTATIRVIAEDGLTELVYTVIFDLNTSMEKTDGPILKTYANRMTIYVKSSFISMNDEVEVYNITGHKILYRRIKSTFEQIHVSDPPGIYIVKVKSAGKVYTEKVILNSSF